MDEKENGNYFETLNNELPEGIHYDVFSENDVSTSDKAKSANREYLNVIYNGGIKMDNADVRMTRSQYIERLNDVEKTFQEEKQNCKKIIFLLIVVAIIGVLGTIYFHSLALNISGMIGTMLCSFFLNLWASVSVILIIFLIFTIRKKKKGMKKARQKAIEHLEQRKHDLMLLGQYDTSR